MRGSGVEGWPWALCLLGAIGFNHSPKVRELRAWAVHAALRLSKHDDSFVKSHWPLTNQTWLFHFPPRKHGIRIKLPQPLMSRPAVDREVSLMIKGTKRHLLGPDPDSQREVFPGPPSGHWFSKGRSELLLPCVFR